MPRTESDLRVITETRNLASYVMTITRKSPKFFRFNIVADMHRYALSALENMVRANETFVSSPNDHKMIARRYNFQLEARTSLKLLGLVSQIALEQECILLKQFEYISRKIHECMSLLIAWMNSDQKRFRIGQNML